jgi:hypothetical protein
VTYHSLAIPSPDASYPVSFWLSNALAPVPQLWIGLTVNTWLAQPHWGMNLSWIATQANHDIRRCIPTETSFHWLADNSQQLRTTCVRAPVHVGRKCCLFCCASRRCCNTPELNAHCWVQRDDASHQLLHYERLILVVDPFAARQSAAPPTAPPLQAGLSVTSLVQLNPCQPLADRLSTLQAVKHQPTHLAAATPAVA